MARFGYQISHEQYSPRDLLDLAKKAERAGFQELASSDHLFPWSKAQGQSGFAWTWIGAALEATSLPIGVVNCPFERYHPVIIAQAVATLCQMYPGRFWASFGSGEFLNEHITGNHWPDKDSRYRKLEEAIGVMRRLWNGERFSHKGEFITAEEVQLYTLPEAKPVAIAAAISAPSAAKVSAWADGLYTTWKPHSKLDDVIDAFRSGKHQPDQDAKPESSAGNKPLILKVDMSCAASREEAIRLAHDQWRTNVGTSSIHAELRMPEQYEDASIFTGPEEVAKAIRISQDPEEHIELIRKDIALGFDKIIFHNVGRNQEYFLNWFPKEVLSKV